MNSKKGKAGSKGAKAAKVATSAAQRSSSLGDPSDMVLPTSSSLQDILQMALKFSLTGGDFIDTKFYLYSRRTASGIVKAPRAVYANSLSLKKVSAHFERGLSAYILAHFSMLSDQVRLVLSSGFRESASTRLDVTSHEDEETSQYEYESDSDLEDEDDENKQYPLGDWDSPFGGTGSGGANEGCGDGGAADLASTSGAQEVRL